MRTAPVKAIALPAVYRANLSFNSTCAFQHSRTRVIYAEGSALQCIHCYIYHHYCKQLMMKLFRLMIRKCLRIVLTFNLKLLKAIFCDLISILSISYKSYALFHSPRVYSLTLCMTPHFANASATEQSFISVTRFPLFLRSNRPHRVYIRKLQNTLECIQITCVHISCNSRERKFYTLDSFYKQDNTYFLHFLGQQRLLTMHVQSDCKGQMISASMD